MSDRKWLSSAELPPVTHPKRLKSRWNDFVDELQENPGEWTFEVVKDGRTASVRAHELKHGTRGGSEAGQIEAFSRTVHGESRVYARWVGDS